MLVRRVVVGVVAAVLSATRTRTGQRATWWRVTTTGLMDHRVTGASCGA